MGKTIKVKVIKCSSMHDSCWYKEKINEIFTVHKNIHKRKDGNWFAICGQIESDTNLYYGGILEQDCEFISEID